MNFAPPFGIMYIGKMTFGCRVFGRLASAGWPARGFRQVGTVRNGAFAP